MLVYVSMNFLFWFFFCTNNRKCYVCINILPNEMCSTIIALKASGRDCTNNNELLHNIGVLQRYAIL